MNGKPQSIDTVSVLGSTGSIGVSTLSVIRQHSKRYRVYGLSANRNVSLLFEQCEEFHPQYAVMVCPDSAVKLQAKLSAFGSSTIVRTGQEGLAELASGESRTIVCGIVGSAGLKSVMSAVEAGKKVLVANKEPLVMMGDYIVEQAKKHGACLLPVDSEHNAIFQCLPQPRIIENNGNAVIDREQGVRKLILTASGGPFRTLPLDEFKSITPDRACAHPNWQMGKKISVDSATMMNKGLELIEACALFGLPPEKIEIVIHPQSIIHSMVEYIDGSFLAQLGSPDMRVPISNALGWPERIESGASSLDFAALCRFDFETPDAARFPALDLARSAAALGGNMPTVMNAANEIAVEAFLDGRIGFLDIGELVEKVLAVTRYNEISGFESVMQADSAARKTARDMI